MGQFTTVEIVRKLIGPIIPVGETNQDDQRFENLKETCELVNELIIGIDYIARTYKDSYEFSVSRSQEYATNFLTNKLGIK